MRTGLSTIHQTLTPEASTVLNQSIAEASRRHHSQTTPLHVAATLLSSPSGHLRQACVKSHPHSSHPLQCRALELCFSVALDRLPSAAATAPSPPISNALMAALKRAQAHQRRGCPEQQQQPLLAVKVELEQLIVSILDDPSVSRVMREASFSSPAVKAAVEQSMATNSPSTSTTTGSSVPRGLGGLRPMPNSPLHGGRTLYLNPRLHQQNQNQNQNQHPNRQSQAQPIREEEVKKVLDVFSRSKKRNPVLVGDSEPETLMKEVLQRIEKKEGVDGALENVNIISVEREFDMDRSEVPKKLKDLGDSIETQLENGVVIDLGDLKWLVEAPTGALQQHQQQQQLVSEVGRAAVAEMGALLRRFEDSKRVWIIGSASCATYLRCQVYHPSMESDWDLQAVPIAPRAPMPSLFPSATSTGILSSSVESLTPSRAFSPLATVAVAAPIPKRPLPDRKNMCLACVANYEKELAKLVPEKPPSHSNPLPQWLQAAKVNAPNQKQSKEQENQWKQKTEELLVKWKEACSLLHPNANPIHPSPARSLCQVPTISPCLRAVPTSPISPPVGTELALGRSLEQSHKIRVVNSGGCTLDFFSKQQKINDAIGDLVGDMFKRVYKGLMEEVAWQPEAASSAALAVAGCRSGGGARRRVAGTRNDTWLLFVGPDKVGKRRMAAALSELVFGAGGGDRMVTVSLAGGEEGDSDARYWGKVAVDRIAEAVRRNPFAVFVLEDVDRADVLVQGSVRQAAEKGRLPDSHGREVSLGSAIFVLTSGSAPENFKASIEDSAIHDERRLEAAANHGWQLELLVKGKAAKRRPEWLKVEEGERQTKQKKDPSGGLSLDLNLAVGGPEDEAGDSSHNSSDVTVELERAHDHWQLAVSMPSRSLPPEFVSTVDDTIVFKRVDFSPLKCKVADVIRGKFELVMGRERVVEVEDAALDGIVGGVWFGCGAEADGFEVWVERVVVPSFWQLKNRGLAEDCASVVKLVAAKDSYKSAEVGGLPGRISIVNSS